jgi:hypothetical protein
MASSKPSYLIIGAGVFGVSTAYHLIQKYPNASVTLIDRDAYDAESRVAASWDWNKVVRADYDDKVYCRLALEAQDIFKSDPLWQPHFHQTGVYWACRSDYAQTVITHHKDLGRNDDIIALPVTEARRLYGGLFDNADYTGVKEVLINRASGWAAAGDALRAVTKRCLELGVKYVTADVSTLMFDGRGSCTGLKMRSGEVLSATHIIVAAGAFTPTLLEWSAATSGNPGLRAGERILAAGITTGMAQLNEEQYKRFKDMPVGFQGYTPQEGKISEYICANSAHSEQESPLLVASPLLRMENSSGGDQRFSQTLERYCLGVPYHLLHPRTTTISGRYLGLSSRTLSNPGTCGMDQGVRIGK